MDIFLDMNVDIPQLIIRTIILYGILIASNLVNWKDIFMGSSYKGMKFLYGVLMFAAGMSIVVLWETASVFYQIIVKLDASLWILLMPAFMLITYLLLALGAWDSIRIANNEPPLFRKKKPIQEDDEENVEDEE